MSDYAVINPATGETVKEYPTITDDELRDAIARADAAYRAWGRWNGSSTRLRRTACTTRPTSNTSTATTAAC